jgi:P27 family predicted phage terminase small subunit
MSPDPDDEVEQQAEARPTRRMTPGDRQQAELAAALQAKLTGRPVFPFPAELNDDHKPYWVEVVNSKPHDYFNLGDIHLLKLYCRVAADIDRLDREIASEGSVVENTRGNPIVNPRCIVRSMAETRLLSLSTKLRLQPSSRYDSEDDRGQSAKKKKADAAVRTMHDDDDGDDLIARGRLN